VTSVSLSKAFSDGLGNAGWECHQSPPWTPLSAQGVHFLSSISMEPEDVAEADKSRSFLDSSWIIRLLGLSYSANVLGSVAV